MRVALVVPGGKVVRVLVEPSLSTGSEEEVLEQLYRLIDDLMSPEVDGIGIGVPSVVDTELGIEIASAQDLIDFATAYNNKEYGEDLVATVTADLTFDATSSAAFNATKGIGLKVSYYGDAEDYYFNGVFNGNNHSISGLEATCPLFKATSSSALIEDLTIDNTCSFAFTHSKAAELDAGAVVGYHRGTLSNVDVAADVSLAAVESVDKVTALGGLVGRVVVGSVENNSSYSGNIVVPAGFQSSDQKIYIGGLVGWISNGTAEPVLYITTELELTEAQTMMLSFLSNVNEEHILNGRYEGDEKERVIEAGKILKDSPIYIEVLPDFSLQDVENKIKKNIRDHDVSYIAFDYIHTSLRILEEISKRSAGVRLREDNILFMLSIRLKDICNKYGVFILSATQLNQDY